MNDLMNLLKERRTYRRFCQKPISEEILAEILTAARYASSAANKQPLSYVVVKTPQKVQEVFAETKWAAYLPKEQGQPKAGEEPVLFMAGCFNQFQGQNRFVILTTEANASVSMVHERMPLVLESKEIKDWVLDDDAVEFLLHKTPVSLNRKSDYEQIRLF